MTDAITVSAPPRPSTLLAGHDAIPTLLVFGLVGVALSWGQAAGLHFTVPVFVVVSGPLLSLGMAFFYARVRPHPRVSEIALYVGLWLLYPAFGVEFTYLVTRFDLPLRDQTFMAWDRALGFDWMGWARFVLAHPAFKTVGDIAYSSTFWQPLVAIPALAWFGPKGGNGELLTSIMLGLLFTTIVYGLLPTIGPADLNHVKALQGQVITALRSGVTGPFTYTGVISFPSFHTVMAILFTLAARFNRWLLAGFAVLNAVMLTAVPFQGDHYLCDMIAGAIIAGLSFWTARRLIGTWDRA